MLKHYLLATIRHLWKRRLYTVISILSLTLGLSVFSLIFLHVKWELSYDRGWDNSDRIYRMVRQMGGMIRGSILSSSISLNDHEGLSTYLDEMVESVSWIATLSTTVSDVEPTERLSLRLIDENFADVFNLEIVEGSLADVVSAPGRIAVNETFARHLFAESPAIGQSLSLEGGVLNMGNGDGSVDRLEGKDATFEVAAVFRLPAPISVDVNFTALTLDSELAWGLIPLPENYSRNYSAWVLPREGISPEKIETDLVTYVDEVLPVSPGLSARGQKPSEVSSIFLEALHNIHFNSRTAPVPEGNFTRVVSFAIVGVLVLLAGCSNSVSIGLASALERTREVGIRKSVGALQSNITRQFIGESLVLSLGALVPVLFIAYTFHPVFAEMLSFRELPDPGIKEILLVSGITLLTGVLVGIYPALVLARKKPVDILKPEAVNRKMHRFGLRESLVCVQFCFASMLLLITLSLYLQLGVVRAQPLGFDPRNIATVFINSEGATGSFESLKNRVEQTPGLSNSIVGGVTPIAAQGVSVDYQLKHILSEEDGIDIENSRAYTGQFAFLGIPLLAGREFSNDFDSANQSNDTNEEAAALKAIINRAAAQALGFDNPEDAIGKRIYRSLNLNGFANSSPLDVIGIVENSRFQNLRQIPVPTLYTHSPRYTSALMIRFDDSVAGEIDSILNHLWLDVLKVPPAAIRYHEQIVNQTYAVEQRESRLLLFCAGLSLFLSCVGLYGLVLIAMRTSTKEIGMRKALGASTVQVISTFLRRFSMPVLLANIIACPVAVYFVLQWIERFPYQMDKGWLVPICLGTSTLVVMIAWLTVSALIWKAANTRPIKYLRYE